MEYHYSSSPIDPRTRHSSSTGTTGTTSGFSHITPIRINTSNSRIYDSSYSSQGSVRFIMMLVSSFSLVASWYEHTGLAGSSRSKKVQVGSAAPYTLTLLSFELDCGCDLLEV